MRSEISYEYSATEVAKQVFSMAYSNLTDAEPWEALAANSEAMAQIAKYQLAIAKGRIDPTMQAKLIASDMRTLAKLQRKHDAYYVELRRRHSQKRPRRKIKRGR
jgi:hypothetical protein